MVSPPLRNSTRPISLFLEAGSRGIDDERIDCEAALNVISTWA
jgi:hypothetical protein